MPQSKLRTATADPEAECALDMSPMIDMVFLLLIFFIVNATAIVVKTDPEVKPPIAAHSKAPEVKEGRIVINVREDGTYTNENLVILKDEKDIFDMVKIEKDKIDRLGQTPKLHLRGDKETVFRHSRVAIRASAAAGVDQVIFAVFVREP
jgi:biopolymer transport protein ExbD